MKITMCYPQMRWGWKDIEVSEEKFEEIQNMTDEQQAEFILDNLHGSEYDDTMGKKNIVDALDAEYAYIRKSRNQ